MTTFRHLKIFVTVAQYGTMRKAAEILYISQPSVSQAIQELEQHYGVKLFDRLSRHIYITEAGKILLSYAQQMIHLSQTMEDAMKQTAAAPILRIGSSVTVGAVYLEGLVSKLEEQIPGIDIRVTVHNTSAIEQLVLSSELDFAIVEGLIINEDLIQKTVCEDKLMMVVGRTHPFYTAPSLTLEQLQGQSLISREKGSVERNQFEQFMAEQNIHMVKKWCYTSPEAIKHTAIAGKGIAILSQSLITTELENNLLRVLPIKEAVLKRDFKLILHKNKILSPEIRAFIESDSNLNPSCIK